MNVTEERNLLAHLMKESQTGIVMYKPVRDHLNTITDFEIAYFDSVAQSLVDWVYPSIYRIGKLLSTLPWFNNEVFEKYKSVIEDNVSNTYEMSLNETITTVRAVCYQGMLLITFTDCTAQYRLQAEKEEALRLFQSIFFNPAVGIGLCDTNGCFIEANNVLLDMIGYSKAEFLGTHIQAITIEDDREKSASLFTALLKGEIDSYSIEKQYQKKDGHTIWAILHVTAIKDENDRLICAAGIVTDISNRKQLEETIKAAEIKVRNLNAELLEKNKFKDQLLGIIAHDLNGPLHGCMAAFDMILSDEDNYSREELLEFIHLFQSSSLSMSTLLKNLLSWSLSQFGNQSFNLQVLDLKELVEHAILSLKYLIQKKNIQIIYNIQEQSVYADRDMIEIVLRNLISNAIKFSYENSHIEVTSASTATDILLTVKDFGKGMSQLEINNLFDSSIHHSTFGTSGEKGSGLGFSVCRNFVLKHGGKIWVESVTNGTTVLFTLPKHFE